MTEGTKTDIEKVMRTKEVEGCLEPPEVGRNKDGLALRAFVRSMVLLPHLSSDSMYMPWHMWTYTHHTHLHTNKILKKFKELMPSKNVREYFFLY